MVLFFYPRDDTPICTREACAFRDAYAQFQQANAELLGVSRDAVERHDQFAARHRLPYSLISDSSGRVHALYGVRRTLGIFPERVTFVIDRAGIIRLRYSASFAADRHAQEARQALVAISTPS